MNEEKKPDNETTDDQMAAAKDAAGQAAEQAREFAADAATAIKALDPPRLFYLIALVVLCLCALVFNRAKIRFQSSGAVSETVASAQRDAQKLANASAPTILQSGWPGVMGWLAALGGIGVVIWSATTKSKAAWVPLAEAGCAAFAVLMLLLSLVFGFPGSVYDDVHISSTLLGYWIPLLAAGAATFFSVKRIMDA